MNLRLGPISRILSPGYGCCGRCRTTWNFVRHHTTFYTAADGCFPLCEKCWQDLESPEARLPFYRALWSEWLEEAWRRQGAELRDPGDIRELLARWPQIEAAVRAGG